MTHVIVISHGSRSTATKREVLALIARLSQLVEFQNIHSAFLEIESPSIPEAIGQCVTKGATRIVVLLNFLNAGRHVDVDIPRIIAEENAKYPQVTFQLTPPLGQHPQIPGIFANILKPLLA